MKVTLEIRRDSGVKTQKIERDDPKDIALHARAIAAFNPEVKQIAIYNESGTLVGTMQ